MKYMIMKILLALKDTKIVYRSNDIVIGFNVKTLQYDLYTVVSSYRLLYFDSANTKEEVLFKLQVIK